MKNLKRFDDYNNIDTQNEGVKTGLLSGLAALSMMISSCEGIKPKEFEKIQNQIDTLKKEESLGDTTSYKDQSKPKRYIVTFRFRELYSELTINKVDFTFDIPVDEEYYNKCQVGELVERDVRSFTDYSGGEVFIEDKKIEY
jgi:hypothetical protein